ncbi:MAG: TonB-dependent receptor [Sphingobacteriales bacterium]|jgi:iron complex outermembrane receptor protein|nr:TonB-dependent receptor [Sphingobacteriales bacterium]
MKKLLFLPSYKSMKFKQILFILPILILQSFLGLGQHLLIRGVVLDEQSLKPLPGTSVVLDKKFNALTDSAGFFSFKVEPGKHQIKVSRIGYKNYNHAFEELLSGKKDFQVLLEPFVNQLGQLVISGSRSAKEVAREVSSVNIIQPYLIANSNATDLSEVLNKVPGVMVVDGQVTIRGGVGFSYNTGSRVAVLLDDMPLLGADLADVRWTFLPIESAEQIEVIKGSASVLYGSSALNGTVNVRTGWGTKKPQTKLQFYQGVLDNPRRRELIWWSPSTQPSNAGMFYSHKQSWGKFDLVLAGNLNSSHSHLQFNDAFRARNYLKTRYRVSKNFNFGLNVNTMIEKAGRFFIWQDADSGALKPFDNYVVDDFYRIVSFDPHAELSLGKTVQTFKVRMYQIKRFVDRDLFPKDNDAIANLYAFDYNLKASVCKGLDLTAGSYLTSLWAVGNVYKGEFAGFSAAGFSQLDYRYKRWSFVLGGRYELNGLGDFQDRTGLLKRIGANYQFTEKTFIRANYSEGYRFPTIGEKYVEDKAADLRIFPNPNLVSEKGWTAEIGIQKGFKLGNFSGALDFAIFNQEFDSMIEFRFGQWLSSVDYPNVPIFQRIGFKAANIGQTRTAGFEITLTGEGRIGDVLIRTLGGFTYSMPVSITDDPRMKDWGNYTTAFFDNMGGLDSAKYYHALLPYRNRTTAKWDIEAGWKKCMIGYAFNYFSTYEKIDPFFLVFTPTIKSFFDRAGAANLIHNVRVSYQVTEQSRLAFLINNLSNEEYAMRPTKIDAMRSYNIQLRVMF